MKHLVIRMSSGTTHKVLHDGTYTDFGLFQLTVRELDLDFMEVTSFEVIEKLKRKRVEVNVTVNMVLEMDEDVDAETVVKDGSFDEFTVYISEEVKHGLKLPRELDKDSIEADQISIEDVEIVNEDELA